MTRSRKSEVQELMDRVLTQCPEILHTCPCPSPEISTSLRTRGWTPSLAATNLSDPTTLNGQIVTAVKKRHFETLPVEFQEKITLTSGLFQLFYCFECIPGQVVQLKTKRTYSNVNVVQKSEFVPSLMSLAAEAFVKRKSSDMNDLPRKLREYVENFTESAPATGSK